MWSPPGSIYNPHQLLRVIPAVGDVGPDYTLSRGKIKRSPPVLGESVASMITLGQSNSANNINGLYTPTSPKVENLNIYDGAIYRATDPLLGCSGIQGTWMGRLGDRLIVGGRYQRVVITPISIGGTEASEWAVGGICNHRIGVAVSRLASAGLGVTHILWEQGAEDNLLGTSKATYKTRVTSVINTFRALGVTAPFYVARSSIVGGFPISDTITAAQAELINPAASIYGGADGDSIPTSPTYRYDGVHFAVGGAELNADLWYSAVMSYP